MSFLTNKITFPLPALVAFGAVLAMVFGSYALHKGVWLLPIFPALMVEACGKCRHWNCSPWQMWVLSVLSALLGVALVHVGPDWLYPNMLVAMLVCAAFLAMSKTNFFPIFSLALLPVYLQVDCTSYVWVVGVCASLAAALRSFSDRNRLVETTSSLLAQADAPFLMVHLLLQLVALLPLFVLAAWSSTLFFVLPTLVFAYMEMANRADRCTLSGVDCLTQMLWALLLGTVADASATWCVEPFVAGGQCVLVAAGFTCFAAVALLLFRIFAANGMVFLPSIALLFFPFLRSGNTSYVLAVSLSAVYVVVVSHFMPRLLGRMKR